MFVCPVPQPMRCAVLSGVEFLPDEFIVKVIIATQNKPFSLFRHSDFPAPGSDAALASHFADHKNEEYQYKLSDFALLCYLPHVCGLPVRSIALCSCKRAGGAHFFVCCVCSWRNSWQMQCGIRRGVPLLLLPFISYLLPPPSLPSPHSPVPHHHHPPPCFSASPRPNACVLGSQFGCGNPQSTRRAVPQEKPPVVGGQRTCCLCYCCLTIFAPKIT
jgi:hypothetical protein